MTTQTMSRRALKLALMASISFAALAANAFFIPKPGCSQGAYKYYVSVKWSYVSDAIGYYVFRSGNTDFNSASAIAAITDPTTTAYQDYGVKPGAKYYYWILPVDSAGDGHYNMSGYAMGYAPKPSVPAPTVSAGSYPGYIKVSWKAIAGAGAYEIYYSSSTTRYDDQYFDSNFSLSGSTYSTHVTGTTPLRKYYFWLGAYFNGYRFLSKVSKAGWRKKTLTLYTPKVVLIPSDAATGMSWWYCMLSGDLIVPSKASLTCSVKSCASFHKYGALDDDGLCGDITGKKNGKAYITVEHSKLKVKSKAITIIKAGVASSSASAS